MSHEPSRPDLPLSSSKVHGFLIMRILFSSRCPFVAVFLLVMLIPVAAPVQAAAVSSSWLRTGAGAGEFRWVGDVASDSFEIEVRGLEFERRAEREDFIILAVAAPGVEGGVKAELMEVRIRNRNTGREEDWVVDEAPNVGDVGSFVRVMRQRTRVAYQGWLGDHYLVGISFETAPVHFAHDPARMRIKVTIDSPQPVATATRQWRASHLGRLERLVMNPDDLPRLFGAPPPAMDLAATRWNYHERRGAGWWMFDVTREGIHSIRAVDLARAGLESTPESMQRLRLFREGVEVPTHLAGGALLFHGVPSKSEYSRAATYWMVLEPEGAVEPTRIRASERRGVQVEADQEIDPDAARVAADGGRDEGREEQGRPGGEAGGGRDGRGRDAEDAGEATAAPAATTDREEADAGEAQEALPDEAEALRSRFDISMQELRVGHEREVVTRRDRFLTILDSRWVDSPLRAGVGHVSEFDLPRFVPGQQNNRLRVRYFMTTGDAPRQIAMEARLNGVVLGTQNLSILSDAWLDWAIPAEALKPNGNRLVLTPAVGSVTQGLYLEAFEITYWRDHFADRVPFELNLPVERRSLLREFVIDGLDPEASPLAFDISEPLDARLVALAPHPDDPGRLLMQPPFGVGGRFMLLDAADALPISGLRRPVQDALSWEKMGPGLEVIIITHPEFEPQAQMLASHHQLAGRPAMVVNIHALEAEYSYGQQSPDAIRRFLVHASDHWPTPPGSVILLGDATHDYRGEFRNEVRNFIPSYRMMPDGLGRAGFPSDLPFACVLGRDDLPDLVVSRLSVANAADARAVVEKLIAAASTSKPGPWRARMAQISDSGEFGAEIDELRVDFTPPFVSMRTVHLGRLPWINNFLFSREEFLATRSKISPAATTAVREIFEDGAATITYYGHGSPNIWSDQRMWFGGGSPNSDNLLLNNFPMLPFVANMTCNTGAIDYPLPPWNICMTEDLMRQPRGGAIAVLAPGGLGTVQAHRRVSHELHRALFDRQIETLGDVVTLVRQRYMLRGFETDLLRMYIYMGDPYTRRQRPDHDLPVLMAGGSRYALPGLASAPYMADVPAALVGGRYEVLLRGPDGALRERQEGVVEDARLDARLETVMDAEGLWRLEVMVWNDTTDGWGGTEIQIGHPTPELHRIAIEKRSEGEVLSISLRNRGEIPVYRRPVDIEWGDAFDAERPFELHRTVLLDLEPRAATSFEFAIPATEWPRVWRATFPVTGGRRIPAQPFGRQEASQYLTVQMPEGDLEPGIRLIPSMSGFIDTLPRRSPRLQAELWLAGRVPMSGLDTMESVWVVLNGPEGREMARERLALSRLPGPTVLPMQVELPATWTNWGDTLPFEVAIDWDESEDIRPEAIGTLEWTVDRLPDPNLVSIEVLNPWPTEGETVMVQARVRNDGRVRARNVQLKLHALLGDVEELRQALPEPGAMMTPLLSFESVGADLISMAGADDMPDRVRGLEPGLDAVLTARWDPFEPAGSYYGLASVIYDQGALDPAPASNFALFHVQFRRQFELAFTGSPAVKVTAVDPRRRLVRLDAELVNRGETEAQRVEVRFYASEADAQHGAEPVHVHSLDVVAPGQSIALSTEWQLNAEQVRAGVRPVVQAAVKGSRQRIRADSGETAVSAP